MKTFKPFKPFPWEEESEIVDRDKYTNEFNILHKAQHTKESKGKKLVWYEDEWMNLKEFLMKKANLYL